MGQRDVIKRKMIVSDLLESFSEESDSFRRNDAMRLIEEVMKNHGKSKARVLGMDLVEFALRLEVGGLRAAQMRVNLRAWEDMIDG